MLALKPDERRALLLLGADLRYKEIGELNGVDVDQGESLHR